MTISTDYNRNEYSGNGTNDTFPYTFLIFDEDDLEVYVDSVLQTISTDYTVTNVGEATGGNVVFESGSIPINEASVVIYRNVPQVQETDYVAGEKFSAETHERALDRLTCMVQQLQDEIDRSYKLARTVTDAGTVELDYDAASRANKFFGFDESGDLVLAQEFGTWKGNWTTTTAYYVGDIVIDAAAGANTKNIYRCTTNHTSGTWATDLAAGDWFLVINVSDVETAQAAAEAAQAAAEAAEAAAQAWHDQGFQMDPSPDSDHTVSGFWATPLTAGENLVYGDFCYLKPADGRFYKADADDEDMMPIVAMAMETISGGGTGDFLFRGFARDDSWSWTAGDLLYASTTAGALSATPPSGTNDIIQPVAIAITSTVIVMNPTYGYAKHK